MGLFWKGELLSVKATSWNTVVVEIQTGAWFWSKVQQRTLRKTGELWIWENGIVLHLAPENVWRSIEAALVGGP
jgi:hypothetical protein